ncbi:hypothetical protein [Thauera sinica]|uniref:Uncharacterized protein n=1 Tax=Thauera sinica TaxID=2665146 RepID=A0ABW1ALJ1_9RHOO|nr:hypothetical protein [Thauera sp. K11]
MRRLLPVLILSAVAAAASAAPRAAATVPAKALPAKVLAVAPQSVPSVPAIEPAADDTFRICFNYGCLTERDISVPGATLDTIRGRLEAAPDAAAEREALAQAVGMLLAVAGRQTPVAADRAGNFLDQEVEGRMDCIDHSTSTTRILGLLEAHGWLRFHRVLEPARRTRLILQHFGAVVEEVAPRLQERATEKAVEVPDHVPVLLALCDCAGAANDAGRPDERAGRAEMAEARPGDRYVIDSWFVDNGEAAIVLPLAEWLDGGGPDVQ